jgi:WD40 repeat protein
MTKLVVVHLGSGNLYNGFPRVIAQLWATDHSSPEQFIGSLPQAPSLIELLRNWQAIYKSICTRQHLRGSTVSEDDELEIDSYGITNVSVVGFIEISQKLHESINEWLKSKEFLNIDRQLRAQLQPTEEIRVIIETNDNLLRRLPWHLWDFFQDYPLGEMALSQPEYKRAQSSPLKVYQQKIRILAILGNSQGIELETETKFLNILADTEIVYLVKPSRKEFNTYLWQNPGWDMLFFAGHSQTEAETGRIYINENQTNNSLTIEQLEEALKQAIVHGLRLVIFNSCDGIGLAQALEKLNIPTVIVMREPVPNLVAQEFFKHFLEGFAVERLPLYLAVKQARRKLQGLEDDFPSASWLPVICQNPAVEPPSWLNLGGIPPTPYRGLFAFREEDAHLFFGREQFTLDLVTPVKRKPLVAVVGKSGSGKSSVIFAGLVPQLRQDKNIQWQIISFRPGNNPIEALAAAFAPILTRKEEKDRRLLELELETQLEANDTALSQLIEKILTPHLPHSLTPSLPHSLTPSHRLVLIADQFEELYTLCSEEKRQPFLDALLNAVRLCPGFTLVIALRADFYGHALSYRPFCDALQGAVINLGSMSREELRLAIEKPAALMHVGLELELTNKLINDVEGQSGHLPLLEFALTTLWAKQSQGLLTYQAYFEIGGVAEALANHAEAVYAKLSEEDRLRAQRLFLQLVRIGDGTEVTRRLATRDEVRSENWDLVTSLASSRLVVTNRNESTSEETVEIVHEALIKSWGRLEKWVLDDREFRIWQEQLRSAIRQWENTGCDESALLRGKLLVDAQHWQKRRQDELSLMENTFIGLSLKLQQREINQQKRRQKVTILGLTYGLVVTSFLATVAFWQSHKASIREIQEISTSSQALFASNNKLDALIKAITAQRKLKTLSWSNPELQTQVKLALQQAIYGAVEHNRLSGHSDVVLGVAFSTDGQIIATGSDDKTAKLWRRDGSLLTTLKGHSDAVYGVAFSPIPPTPLKKGGYEGIIATASGDTTAKLWKKDGTLITTLRGHSKAVYGVAFSPIPPTPLDKGGYGGIIATASDDTTAKLWKPDGTLITTLRGHTKRVSAVAFSPIPPTPLTKGGDGGIIATASGDNTVKLWKRDGTLITTLNGHNDTVSAVAFSPDSQLIVSGSWDNTVKLWRIDGTLITTFSGHSSMVYGVAFSPDGKTIASASWDRTVKLWNRNGDLLTTLEGHQDFVSGVAFSPDSKTIASASSDETVKLWKLENNLLTLLKGHSAAVRAVAFSPQDNVIATGSEDYTVKLWKRNGSYITTLKGHEDTVGKVAFSPDGQIIASASRDKTVKLWNVDGTLITNIKDDGGDVNTVAFSDDGNMIATGSQDLTVKLWKIDGTPLTTLKGHNQEVWGVTFSPDNQTIASASRDNTVKLWKLDGTLITTLIGHRDGVRGVAFSPDGQFIATGSQDNTVKLWRTSDGSLVNTFEGHSGAVWEVAFAPNTQIIASASDDTTVKLWDYNGSLLTTLPGGHSKTVWGVAFSSDGKTLASVSEDRTAILWNFENVRNLDALLRYSCNWVSDYLRTNLKVEQSNRRLCDGVQHQ